MAGATGGIQGAQGTLFGIPYSPGTWQDQAMRLKDSLLQTSHSLMSAPGPKRQSANSSFRRQSGIPRVQTDCPEADIDYRLPTLLVADWNAALAAFHHWQLSGSPVSLRTKAVRDGNL